MSETYAIDAEGITATVTIKSPKYEVTIPKIAPATLALLEDIKRQLASTTIISSAEILDTDSILALRKRVDADAKTIIEQRLPGVSSEVRDVLITNIVNSTLGLGDIEFLMNDAQLEEIVIPSANSAVRVYHKKYGWLETNIVVATE